MLEQFRHIMLHGLELVELQVRIDNREDVAGFGLLVYKHPLSITEDLFFDLEMAFAFEHHRQNVGCRDITRVVPLNDLAQERFGGFLLNGVRWRWRGFIDALPIGNKAFALSRPFAELFLPASLANIEATKRCFFVK